MLTLLYFVLILGLTIFIHELGHFIWAKKSGIYVYEFSLGMGPVIYSFTRKNDETKYALRLFPIGGFVLMAGEEVEVDESVPVERRFQSKRWLSRFATVIAGIIHNFILAIFLFFIVGLLAGTTTIKPIVGEIDVEGAAIDSNLEAGDTILSVNNKNVSTVDIFLLEYQVNYGDTIILEVKNTEGEIKNIEITPLETEDGYAYGFQLDSKEDSGIFAAIKFAFEKFYSLALQICTVVLYLLTGQLSINSLSGPIGIFNVVGQTAEAGFINLVYLTGYLSLNVGIVNLLPIPAFDGGRILFLIIEKIKGKPVSQKTENTFHTIGFILLMILMVVITFNDIVRFF